MGHHAKFEQSQFQGDKRDQRAVAVLSGWLDPMRSTQVHPSADRE